MRTRVIAPTLAAAFALAASATLLSQAPSAGQGAGGGGARGGAPATPATSAPAPARDLTGVWMMRNPPGKNGPWTNFTYTDPMKSPPAITEWGQAQFKLARDSNGGNYTLDETNDPVLTKCYPPGVPRVYFHPYPFEVIQAPKQTLLVYEYDHWMRRVHTDGRALPTDPDLLWMGTSVGKWVDDRNFQVETTGFNEKTWLDRLGHAHSDQLKVTENFRRVDRDHLELDIKMEDPKALARPWVTTFYYESRPNWELGEISCSGDYLDWNKVEKGGRDYKK
jgi:hypothetical protein